MSETPSINPGAKRYNVWFGNPKGTAFRPGYCAEEVYSCEGFGHFNQCSRRVKDRAIYCKQHAKKYEAKP